MDLVLTVANELACLLLSVDNTLVNIGGMKLKS
jgi:hypothetical protein